MDNKNIPKLISKFDFNPRKTYNPPKNMPYDNLELLTSFLIGFIDGDGCIKYQTGRKSPIIVIKVHKSWGLYLTELAKVCEFQPTSYYLNGDQYFQLGFYKNHDVVKLKNFVVEQNLPVLERKWKKIDINYTVRGGIKETVLDLIKSGKTNEEIFIETNISKSYLSMLRKGKRQ